MRLPSTIDSAPALHCMAGAFFGVKRVAVIPLHAGCFILAARARGAFPARMRRRFFACLAQRGGTNEKKADRPLRIPQA